MRDKLIELIMNSNCVSGFAGSLATYLIAHGVTIAEDNNVPSKWIPVSERLPEPHENPVLAVFFGIVNPAWCYSGLWELPSGIISDKVTHWMPLPEPPKGESNETYRR